DDVGIDADASEVGRDPVVHRQINEVRVQAGGHAGGVGVPVQDVERGRLAAQEIVVYPEVPDEIARPQPREHLGKRAAVEVAAPAGHGGRGGGQVSVADGGGPSGALVVEHCHGKR